MFTTLLTDAVTIRTRQLQPNGGYGDEKLVEVAQTSTFGVWRPLGGNEMLVEQSTEIRRATLFLDGSIAITADDQVDDSQGNTWEVTDVDLWTNPRTQQLHHLEVQLQLTKG